MKLAEIYDVDAFDPWGGQNQTLSWFGFHLDQTEERMDDNIKLWHDMTLPNNKNVTLDHSPYELIDQDAFRRYVMFYKQHGRFPTRDDINSNGPLHNKDLIELTR